MKSQHVASRTVVLSLYYPYVTVHVAKLVVLGFYADIRYSMEWHRGRPRPNWSAVHAQGDSLSEISGNQARVDCTSALFLPKPF